MSIEIKMKKDLKETTTYINNLDIMNGYDVGLLFSGAVSTLSFF